jgi:hypothetical protein
MMETAMLNGATLHVLAGARASSILMTLANLNGESHLCSAANFALNLELPPNFLQPATHIHQPVAGSDRFTEGISGPRFRIESTAIVVHTQDEAAGL